MRSCCGCASRLVRISVRCSISGASIRPTRRACRPPSRPGAPFPAGGRWYIPELVPTYDTRQDNLVILDMTGERDLPVMLDELSLLGSRFPRLVILTQEERLREAGEKAFFSAPVGDMLILPSPRRAPVADLHLPVVLEAVGAALADVWRAQSVRSHHGPGK